MTSTLEELESHTEQQVPPVLIIVMGVSGTGKSTLGSALARELGLPYIEGDDLHPQANIDKMTSGVPLNDQDREPWLELIRKTAEDIAMEQQSNADEASETLDDKVAEEGVESLKVKLKGAVAGCSALKKYYRDILRGHSKSATETSTLLALPSPATLPTYFVFINGSRTVLQERIEKRPGHFFKATMLDSQLNTLEDPRGEEGVISVSLESSIQEQVQVAKHELLKLALAVV